MSAALAYDPSAARQDARHEAAAFVLALRGKGVSDLTVLRAMERVPREFFAPRFADLARQDVALPLPYGEAMTVPSGVAAMLAALGPRPGQRVLEIGTGSGYVTALLIATGAEVRSVERRTALAEGARHRLAAFAPGAALEVVCADGLADDEGRYDRILVNGALAAWPSTLTERLGAGGRLVAGFAIGPTSSAGAVGSVRLATMERAATGRLDTRIGAPLRLTRIFVNADRAAETEA